MSLKYYNTAIAMQEIPDEISFVINITGCPHHCEGCHSPHLWENGGYPLSWALDEAFRYVGYISCILFMGRQICKVGNASSKQGHARKEPEFLAIGTSAQVEGYNPPAE